MAFAGLSVSVQDYFPQIILLCIACFLFLHLYLLHRNSRMPINWPVIGIVPYLLVHFHRIHDYITDCLRESGGAWMMQGPRFLGWDIFLTSDPANVRHILIGNSANNYHKDDHFKQAFDVFGDGLFNTNGESWKIQRKFANVYIGDRRYRTFVAASTREKATKDLFPILLRKAETGEAVEIQDLLMRLSMDVTCRIVLGVDLGALSAAMPTLPFSDATEYVWEGLLHRHAMPISLWKTLRWLNVGTEKKLARARRVIDDFLARLIAERKEERRASKSQNLDGDSRPTMMTDILSSYIDNVVQEIEGKFEPDRFLRDNLLTFMIGGKEALVTSLCWLFWLLQKNPEAEAKLMKELAAHAPSKTKISEQDDAHQVFDMEAIGKMVYLNGAVCEVLRMFPPLAYEEKSAIKADILPSGHKVAAGTRIMIPIYAMGRMEEIWGKDCMEFKPERWITEAGGMKHVPAYQFMAFNAGPRICPGKDVSLTQIKTLAAAVIWNFKIEAVNVDAAAPKVSLVLTMKNGMMVKIKRREQI